MTDHAAYIVVLADDIREDTAEETMSALRMIKGVLSVEPVVADLNVSVAKARANQEWTERIMNLVRDANGWPR